MTFTEVKCMIRMMYGAITRRGSEGEDVGMVAQISAPPHPYLKVLPTPLVGNLELTRCATVFSLIKKLN